MNFKDLKYIIAVSELKSFSKAARSCNVSQPSLSAQIKKIENQLGVELFSRTRRQVQITSIGEQIVEKARDILSLQTEIEGIADSFKNELEGKITIGAILTIAPYIFSNLLSQVRQKAPALQLMLKEAKTDELVVDLLENRLDAAIVSLPIDEHIFESRIITRDPFLIAVSDSHPWAKKSSVDIDDLEGESMILMEEGHCFRDQALSLCQQCAIKEHPAYRATSFETIRHLVAHGEGITLMPRIAQKRKDGLHYLPIDGQEYSRDIGLIWRKSSPNRTAMEKLSTIIHSYYQEHSTL